MHAMRRLIVFYRSVRPGVKSRLAATLGPNVAAALYHAMVTDLAGTVAPYERILLPMVDRRPHPTTGCVPWRDPLVQRGQTLSSRMADAFTRAFTAGAREAVLIGSDIPAITTEIISRAFEELQSSDGVIGPTHDGGYYLIGYTAGAFSAHTLAETGGDSASVFRRTVSAFRARGMRLAQVEPLADVDTEGDLRALLHSPGFIDAWANRCRELTRTAAKYGLLREDTPEAHGYDVERSP
jgi:uncharacterized protein